MAVIRIEVDHMEVQRIEVDHMEVQRMEMVHMEMDRMEADHMEENIIRLHREEDTDRRIHIAIIQDKLQVHLQMQRRLLLLEKHLWLSLRESPIMRWEIA